MVLDTLQKRGFLINHKKSRLVPSQDFEWLGVRWDTRQGRLSLPQDKVVAWAQDLRQFIEKPVISRRQLERVLGSVESCSV